MSQEESFDSFDESTRHATLRRRRRTRVLLVVAAVVAALVVAGVAGGAWLPEGNLGAASEPSTAAGKPGTTPSPRLPVTGDLLDGRQIRGLGGPRDRAWTVARTDANTSGDGINSVCQQRRFADPRGDAAMVRAFSAAGTPRRTAVQTVEVSRSARQARRTYLTTLGWYAGCRVARLQVLDAYRVDRVGDQAQVLTLLLAERPSTSVTVAVARTGSVVTSTVGTTVGARPTPVAQVVRTLEVAVRKLCVRTVAGRCVTRPAYRPVPPPPAGPGEERGVLAVADLPAVGRVDEPWVGTRTAPAGASSDPSVTRCGSADFRGAGALRSRSRTYLVPQSTLPARFGLTETYGTFASTTRAARFLSTMRADLAGCEERDVTTDVGRERRSHTARLDASQWLLTTTVSSSEKVPLRVGYVRAGRSVAQLTFTPTPGADLSEDVFGSLLARAGDRLRELPRAGRP